MNLRFWRLCAFVVLSQVGVLQAANGEGDETTASPEANTSAAKSEGEINEGGEAAATDGSYRIELKAPLTNVCNATMSLRYSQRNTLVHVAKTIENPNCGASHGDVTIVIRTLSDDGEEKTLEFPETWTRSDDQPVVIETEYQIGENVDLKTVRSRQLKCYCDDGTLR